MVERIRKWLLDKHYDGVVLGRRDNFTWITGGSKNHVLSSTENGVAYYIITQDDIMLIADCSDLARMDKEQNPLGAKAIEVPWYESVENQIKEVAFGKNFVSDTGIAGFANVQGELIELRLALTDEEVDKYREIGQLCAAIVEGVCQNAKVGQTENEVATALKCECLKHGVSPDCVLVGADERILDYRHPMPTDKKIEKSLMVVLGGEKYGLNISMTRIVYFEEIPKEIRERYGRTQYVFANMQLMMKDGLGYQEYFANVQKLYKEAGYPDEWKMHHQGGPTGYGCREYVVTPSEIRTIHEGQAYAWNPTIQGTKCEETTYLSESGLETFTKTSGWPRKDVETPYGVISVAEILEK